MDIPDGPYIGLYGSHTSAWRTPIMERLDAIGLKYYDPTDAGWRRIDSENGDAQQAEIDALVAKQHRGLIGASCVIFHLAWRKTWEDSQPGETSYALASRCEFGYLTGRGIPTFFHIEPDVEGRNYLWAEARSYPHMVQCLALDEAVERGMEHMRRAS